MDPIQGQIQQPKVEQQKAIQVITQGKLKRIKGFMSSKTELYMILAGNTTLHVAVAVDDKGSNVKITPRYELKQYKVEISQKDKKSLFLDPDNEARQLGLKKVQLVCKNAEERARWFVSLQKAQTGETDSAIVKNMIKRGLQQQMQQPKDSFASSRMMDETFDEGGRGRARSTVVDLDQSNMGDNNNDINLDYRFGDGMTLGQISRFLSAEDESLNKITKQANQSLANLKLQFEDAKKNMAGKEKPNTMMTVALMTAEDFIKQQETALSLTRGVSKRLFELAEELAAREIQNDPKAFMTREVLEPTLAKPEYQSNDDAQNYDRSQMKALRASIRQNRQQNRPKSKIKKQDSSQLLMDVVEAANEGTGSAQIQIIESDAGNQMNNLDQFSRIESVVSPTAQDKRSVQMMEFGEDSEDDDNFYDAIDFIQLKSFKKSVAHNSLKKSGSSGGSNQNSAECHTPDEERKVSEGDEEEGDEDPIEREQLPFLKDPNVKVSIWAIIKDSIGKDISKMAVPVYFNDPTSLLQKCAQSMEYNFLLEQAADEPDPLRRLALVSVHVITCMSICERTATKPFNPILGETYEYKTENFEYLAEQVSHHPPVTAINCRGKKYNFWTNQKTNTKFTGKTLLFHQQYKTYIDFPELKERYEIQSPPLSAHNLIIGNTYIDLGDQSYIHCVQRPSQKCVLNFTRRGWLSKEEFKVDGTIFEESAKKKALWEISGNWNNKVYINKAGAQRECVWTKAPYPEQWESMYGLSHFMLQLNYFPRRLHNVVAPTDTRRRPDQRALENGEYKTASVEKDRLENMQRAQRKYHEAQGTHFQPAYFETWFNPADQQEYFVYKNNYFEKDRKEQNWGHLPPIFSDKVPDHLVQYMPKGS